MKRIIPILIVIVICISVIPFAVNASYSDAYAVQFHVNTNVTTNLSGNIDLYFYVYDFGSWTTFHINRYKYVYNSTVGSYILTFYTNSNYYCKFTYSINTNKFTFAWKTITTESSLPNDYYTYNSSDSYEWSISYNRVRVSTHISINNIAYEFKNFSNLTLLFNSNGGSPVAPITDIEPNSTINLVDQFGFYLPQFVPTRTGFIFDYWYDIDNPLQAVRSLTVTEDTVLNAKYTVDSTYTSIYFTSGFYHDSACTNAISGRVIEQIGSTYTFYYDSSNATGNFHGQITLDGNGYSKEYTGTEVSSGIYKYDIIVPSVETTVNVLTYETYECTLHVFGGIWNDYVANVYINGTPVLTDQQVIHFDSYTGIHLEFDMYPPYVITEITFTDVFIGPPSYKLDFNISDTIVEMVGGDWGFYSHIDAYCYPNQEGVISVFNRSITEYDITSRAPIIVYDESGNASWAFSEVDVMDTDWSQVQENIPRKLFGIFDGLFTLEGLAVLIPVIMMVSFTVWFIRRS